MKAIILSAGRGSRLGHLTDDRPKCMVEYKGKMIIDYIIDTIRNCNINDIVVIAGYKKEVLYNHFKNEKIKFYTNENFDNTNMVYTLFCAESEMNDDIIISYSDIIYSDNILSKLIKSKADLSVIVDKDWKQLWQRRMPDPLKDAETMKIDENDNIIELGKKPQTYSDIQGQYIGLIKISKSVIDKIKKFYHSLDKNKLYDNKDFNNMYMTSFIQSIIDKLLPVSAVYINGGWMEFDTPEDFKLNNFI